MATYRAVGSACEAIIRLLQQSWQPDLFDNAPLVFRVYGTNDFADQPIKAGVSLFLYRVAANSIQRTPPARPGPNGQPRPHQLPLDLHFMLTPWAKEASLEQQILGWMMRTLEDTPVIGPGLLNAMTDGVFASDESIEIVLGSLTNEEMFRIWDVLAGDYRVSVPYVARVIRIDSSRELQEAGPVLTRQLDFGTVQES